MDSFLFVYLLTNVVVIRKISLLCRTWKWDNIVRNIGYNRAMRAMRHMKGCVVSSLPASAGGRVCAGVRLSVPAVVKASADLCPSALYGACFLSACRAAGSSHAQPLPMHDALCAAVGARLPPVSAAGNAEPDSMRLMQACRRGDDAAGSV